MTVLPSTRRCPNPDALAFATMFGLPAYLAEALAGLYAGEPVTIDKRQAAELRGALETVAIDTTNEGYRLTDEGKAECQKAADEFMRWIMTGRQVA